MYYTTPCVSFNIDVGILLQSLSLFREASKLCQICMAAAAPVFRRFPRKRMTTFRTNQHWKPDFSSSHLRSPTSFASTIRLKVQKRISLCSSGNAFHLLPFPSISAMVSSAQSLVLRRKAGHVFLQRIVTSSQDIPKKDAWLDCTFQKMAVSKPRVLDR